jgi:hypothetical protein
MSTGYAREDEEPDINSPIVMDSVADQETSDVIDPVSKVPFVIKKASIRKQHLDPNDKSSSVEVTRLVIDAAIGADGVDTEGKYANKHLFTELILTFNKETHTGDWWLKRSRGPTKQFLQALGFDPATPPTIDADFLSELGGREFIADIRKRPMQEKTGELNDKGKPAYRDTGDFKNELTNFRAATE